MKSMAGHPSFFQRQGGAKLRQARNGVTEKRQCKDMQEGDPMDMQVN